MRKILSMVLALVLVLGMAFPAFGAGFGRDIENEFPPVTTFPNDNVLTNPTEDENNAVPPILQTDPMVPNQPIDPMDPNIPTQPMIPLEPNIPTQPIPEPVVPLLPAPEIPQPPVAQPIPAPAPLVLGYSIQSTAPNSGAVSTNMPNTMTIGDTFQATFSMNSFNWKGTLAGNYDIGTLKNNWLKMTGATVGQHFSVTGITVNPSDGVVTVGLQALIPYTGNVRIYMDSGNGATSHVEKAVTVSENIARITATKSGGTAPSITSHIAPPQVYPGDTISFRVPANNFNWNTTGRQNAESMKDTSWIRLSGGKIGTDFRVVIVTPPNSNEVLINMIPLKTGTYRNVTLSLQGGGGTATTASDPVTIEVLNVGAGRITGIASGSQLGGKGSGAQLNGKTIPYSQLGGLEVHNKDELLLPLYAGFFTWEGTTPFAESPVTTAQLRQGNIGIQRASRSGSRAIDSRSPEIVNRNGQAYISVKFTDDTTALVDIDFAMTMYPTINRSRYYDAGVEIYGTLTQDVYEAEFEGEYFDISDGSVVEALNFVRNVELYLGSGVTMYTSLYSGKRYSGTATNEVTLDDDKVLREFPSIEDIIRITTKTLNKASNTVSLDGYSTNLYVYGEDGTYLGRSNQRLPYSSRYYLSTKEIDLKDFLEDNNILEPGYPVPEPPQPGGPQPGDPNNGGNWGTIVTPPNTNDNPGTGR